MKLQFFIMAIATLVAPMIIIAQSEEDMFGEYPYCTECEANYKDINGLWFYSFSEDSWCKIEQKNKCKDIICGPVKGYPCCNNSTEVSYLDADGEWGVENNKWCSIEPSEELDVDITVFAWRNGGLGYNTNNAIFFFTVNSISFEEYKEKYDLIDAELNDRHIGVGYDISGLRYETIFYEDSNYIKLVFKDKKTNKRYIKEFFNVRVGVAG